MTVRHKSAALITLAMLAVLAPSAWLPLCCRRRPDLSSPSRLARTLKEQGLDYEVKAFPNFGCTALRRPGCRVAWEDIANGAPGIVFRNRGCARAFREPGGLWGRTSADNTTLCIGSLTKRSPTKCAPMTSADDTTLCIGSLVVRGHPGRSLKNHGSRALTHLLNR